MSTTGIGANLVSDILIETRVQLVAEKTDGASLASACFVYAGNFVILHADWSRHYC